MNDRWRQGRNRVTVTLAVLALAGGVAAAVVLTMQASSGAVASAKVRTGKAKAGTSSPRHRGGRQHRAKASRATTLKPVALDVYAGPSSTAAARRADEQLHGGISGVFDYLPANSWRAIDDAEWLIDAWARTRTALTLAVPMLPSSGATLAAGAAGRYDRYFTRLAQRLVNAGLGATALVPGWNPENSGHPWAVTNTRTAREYVRFWRRVVVAMTVVRGAHFSFIWDIGEPTTIGVSPEEAYPGNAYVNTVATSAFDAGFQALPARMQWSTTLNQTYGAAWAARFAHAHGRRLAVLMLGVAQKSRGGGGDNRQYIDSAIRWAQTTHAASITVWDYGRTAILDGSFPKVQTALVTAVKDHRISVPATN